MDLLDLFVKISVDDKASGQMESISSGMIAKGQLIATGIASAITAAVGAVSQLMTSIIDAYAQYEQLAGGIETFFGDAADTVISNSKKAYETAGMSANQYMSTVSMFATSLVRSVAERNAESTEDSGQQAVDALQSQYEALSETLNDELTAMQQAFADTNKELSRSLADELDDFRKQQQKETKERTKQLNSQYEAREKELKNELDALSKQGESVIALRRKQLDEEYDQLSESLDKQVDAYQKATDARIKEIDREYRESLKNIDREEYERLKAIDDQIAAIRGLTEAEEKEAKKRVQAEQKAELEKQLASAVTPKGKEKARKLLAEFNAKIDAEETKEERNQLIERLKNEKDNVKEEADAQRDALKEKRDNRIESYKQERADGLAELRKSIKEELAERKAQNDAIIEQERANNAERIENKREAIQKELAQLRESNANELEQMREAQAEDLKQRQRHNEDVLTEQQRAQQEQLNQQKKANSKQLEELKNQIKSQKELLKSGANANSEYIEATAEDQKRAAEIADMAIRDMSDNANKMGTSIEMIQNAYQGFAKGNFTMLDNLKLGYGGTRTEMERLLQDAENIAARQGEIKNFSIDSFADIAEAIHIVQKEYEVSGYSVEQLQEKLNNMSLSEQELTRVAQDLGISYEEAMRRMQEGTLTAQDAIVLTGTTSYEASETIEGSINRMKAAWENFLIALVDPEYDAGEAANELADSVGNAAGLIAPRIATAAAEILKVIEEKGPEIAQKTKEAFLNALPEEDRKNLEEDLKNYKDAIDGIAGAINGLIETVKLLSLPFQAVGEGIGTVAADIATTFDDTAYNTAELEAVMKNKSNEMVEDWSKLPEDIRSKFINADGTLTEAGQKIIDGLQEGANNEWEQKKPWWESIGDWIKAHKGPISADATLLTENGAAIINGLMNGASDNWSYRKSFFTDIAPWLSGVFGGAGSWLNGSGNELMRGFGDGINSSWNPISWFFSSIDGDFVGNFVGAEGWLVDSGENVLQGLQNGIADVWRNVINFFYDLPNNIVQAIGDVGNLLWNAGQDIINGFWDGLKDAFRGVQDWVIGIGDWIQNNKGPKQYDLNLLTPNGEWVMESFEKGMRNRFSAIEDTISDVTDLLNVEGSISTSTSKGVYGKPATSNRTFNLYIDKVYARNEEEVDSLSRRLNDLWTREMEGSLV